MESTTPDWVSPFVEAFIGDDVLACLCITDVFTGEEELTEAQALTPMPVDFVPIKASFKTTLADPNPRNDRYQHLCSIDKRLPVTLRGTPIQGLTEVQFETKLFQLRDAVKNWFAPRIESLFIDRMNEAYPELRVRGEKLESQANFLEWMKSGVMDAEKRTIIAYAMFGLWGENNQWAINLEKVLCTLLCIFYLKTKSNGRKPSKEHQGRCFAKIGVAKKGSFVEVIRNTHKRVFKECCYGRTEKPKIVVSATGMNTKGIPYLVQQQPATIETHGFHGLLGLCTGHPLLQRAQLKDDQSTAQSTLPSVSNFSESSQGSSTLSSWAATPPPNGNNQGSVQAWFAANMSKFSSLGDVAAALQQCNIGNVSEGHSVPVREICAESSPGISTLDSSIEEEEEEEEESLQEKEATTVSLPEPKTPESQRIPPDDDKEVPTSPIALELGRKQRRAPCAHLRVSSLEIYNHSLQYWKPLYLKKHPLWPTVCCGCAKKIVDKAQSKVEADEFKVHDATPVYLCQNAANSKHVCKYLLCCICKASKEEMMHAKRGPGDDDSNMTRSSKRSKRAPSRTGADE